MKKKKLQGTIVSSQKDRAIVRDACIFNLMAINAELSNLFRKER